LDGKLLISSSNGKIITSKSDFSIFERIDDSTASLATSFAGIYCQSVGK
jgi:hypothetical protein